MTQILVVFADQDDARTPEPLPQWGQVSAVEATSGWPWAVTRVRYSVRSRTEADVEGIPASDSGASGTPEAELVRTWEILPMLRGPSLVHICHPFTRAGETALVAAKVLGKKVVLSDLEPRSSVIGQSLGAEELADCLVCRSEQDAAGFSHHRRVEILDLSTTRSLSALIGIYSGLIDEPERPG